MILNHSFIFIYKLYILIKMSIIGEIASNFVETTPIIIPEILSNENLFDNDQQKEFEENIKKMSEENLEDAVYDNSDRIENRIKRNSIQRYKPSSLRNTRNILVEDNEFENPFKLPSDVISEGIKSYKFKYNNLLNIINNSFVNEEDETEYKNAQQNEDGEKMASLTNIEGIELEGVPSLFNPIYGINLIGITNNIPLVNSELYYSNTQNVSPDEDISDCSIETLVKLSKSENEKSLPPLGRCTYKYADFMFCKDLGKISNNRLITLRRFALPVGDDIWDVETLGNDVGRLVTWMNDDNKLENVLEYQYSDSWKKMEGEWQEQNTMSDDYLGGAGNTRGYLGSILNLANPTYRKSVAKGTAGDGNVILEKLNGNIFSNKATYQNHEILGMYDKHKIYEPKGTVRDTHKWEGKLEFSKSFSLTFDYELRAYDNINPRAAFADLLGNIQQVTYRKGNFWGGGVWWIGAPENSTGWSNANALIDGTWDKLSSTFQGLLTGQDNLSDILASFSNKAMGFINGVINKGTDLMSSKEKRQEEFQNAKNNKNLAEAGKIALSMLKNQLGRPHLYALNSLLTGEPVGLWHLTIGNPRNPIMSIGNLIIKSSQIQHYGPLGIDDFPTGLKVVVQLEHAKSRDMVEIGKMYTKGRSAIYLPLTGDSIESYIKDPDERTKVNIAPTANSSF